MNVLRIEAGREAVRIVTDSDGAVVVRESVATVGPKPGRTLATVVTKAAGGIVRLPRFENGNDRLFSCYTVYVNGKEAEGVRYVTDIDADVPENTDAYPQPPIIKAMNTSRKYLDLLGAQQTRPDISLLSIMTTVPGEDTIPYRHNGRTYYFIRSKVEAWDARIKTLPEATTLTLLNSPRSFDSTGEKALLDAVVHPGYDWSSPTAFLSAFDATTEEGLGYFGAFVEFLAERYSRPDHKYGHVCGFIISNEVDHQYLWNNCGEMTVEQSMQEYAQTLRYAWLAGRKHSSQIRVYVSLTHWWNEIADNSLPLRFFKGRRVLDLLAEYTNAQGAFDWNVAYHPYPQGNDFWNDRCSDFTFSTPRITFKNMEVLEAYLSQPQFLYKGAPRRIIFSEQGFNSANGPMRDVSEKQAAAGYVLAYLKARNMSTVDMMMHHASVDNPREFGLNLGIYRFDPDAPDHVGEAKPIQRSVRLMDTPEEPVLVAEARACIGEEVFDYILHPPIVYGDRDTSHDNEFG